MTPTKYGSASRANSAKRYSTAMPTRNATTTPTPPPFGCGLRVHLARVRAVQHARCDHPAHHGGGQQRQPDGERQVAQHGGKSHAGSSRTGGAR